MEFFRKLKIKHRLWIVIITIQIIFLVIVFILNNNSRKLLHSTDWIIHTQLAISEIESIERKIVDLETGQRGFLITGREKYLEPFNNSIAEIYEELASFKNLTSDNPRQTAEIVQVKDLLDQKIAELEHTIKLRKEGGFEAAQEIVNSDLGIRLMQEIREGLERLRQEEIRLLKIRSLAPDQAISKTNQSLYMALTLNLVVVLSLSLLFLKSINDPITQFLEVIKGIIKGDKHLRVKNTTRDELGQLAVAFNDMLDKLELSTATNIALKKEINARIKAERILELESNNLEKFFENVNVGIAKNTMDGSFVEINPEFERITGYTVEELNNMSYWDLTPEKYQEQEETQLKSLEEKGKYGPYQKEYNTKQGDLIPVLLNGVKKVDANGNEFIWSVVQDVSESENAKKHLVQDVEKFKLLLETGKIIAFELDLNTQKISTIRDKIKIDNTSFPIEEIQNFTDFFESIKKEHRGACEHKLEDLLQGKIERFTCDFQISHGNRFFWHEGIMTVLEVDESGDPIKLFVTLRNIEEEKNEEIRRLISQEKERLRIARDIHDSIGQLLVGTRLTLKAKKNDLSNLEDIDEMLDLMIKESRLIINNFGLSIQDSNNLRDAFEKLLERMKRVYPGDMNLHWTGRESVDDLKTATHIFRIYQEALSNAIKYSNSPKIDIKIQYEKSFKMEVTDFGVGYDTNQVATGFGMENMKERAREVGAKITMKSGLGEGAKVSLAFED